MKLPIPMARPLRAALLLSVLGAAIPSTASADMMAACAVPLDTFCGSVERGRGRLTACLLGEAANLPASCLHEVQAALSRFNMQTAMSGRIEAVCRADIARVCPAGVTGTGAVTACLAGHMGSLSPECGSTIRSAAQSYADGH